MQVPDRTLLSCEGIARALQYSLDREILSPVRKHPEAGSNENTGSLKSVCSLISVLEADFTLSGLFIIPGPFLTVDSNQYLR